MRRLLPLVLLALGATACASSGGAGGRSPSVALRVPADANAPLGSRMRLTLHAERVCADAACTGRGYYLVVTNASGNEMTINYSPVRLVVGADTYEWLRDENPLRLRPAVGAFVRVPLDESRFRRVAEASAATFWLGSTKFDLTARDLSALRRLLPDA